MMEIMLLIAVVAFSASMLTFFSGFGLGTILTPFFAIFFSIETAIMLTSIVHFLNNIFKLILIGRNINLSILMKFGFASMAGAFAGAYLLVSLPRMEPLFTYNLAGNVHEISIINIIISLLMIIFSVIEVIPSLAKFSFEKGVMIPGGILSGFFGGLSGHQGALRSMFLIKYNLAKETFIATGVGIACLVDISRISIYSSHYTTIGLEENYTYILAALIPAFAGAYFGNKLLKKVTLKFLQAFVSVAIIILALLLGAGLL